MSEGISSTKFRESMAHFASGVTIVTMRAPEGPVGFTASAFSSVSLEPPLVLVCVGRQASLHDRILVHEHFGVSIGYAGAPIDPATARMMVARRPRALELTPVGLPALRKLVEQFIAVGFSKFVLRPVVAPTSWRAELEALATAVGDLQT